MPVSKRPVESSPVPSRDESLMGTQEIDERIEALKKKKEASAKKIKDNKAVKSAPPPKKDRKQEGAPATKQKNDFQSVVVSRPKRQAPDSDDEPVIVTKRLKRYRSPDPNANEPLEVDANDPPRVQVESGSRMFFLLSYSTSIRLIFIPFLRSTHPKIWWGFADQVVW